jgi:hypothetical protein
MERSRQSPINQQTLYRAEQSRRPTRNRRERPKRGGIRGCGTQRTPPLCLDDLKWLSTFAVLTQVFTPQPLANTPRQYSVVGDEIDLGVIEQRVFVEIR